MRPSLIPQSISNTSITANGTNLYDEEQSSSFDSNEKIPLNSTIVHETIDDQLTKYKLNNHNKCMYEKAMLPVLTNCILNNTTDEVNSITTLVGMETTNTNINKKVSNNREVNDRHPWPSNTILMTGDSILNGIEENRLRKKT